MQQARKFSAYAELLIGFVDTQLREYLASLSNHPSNVLGSLPPVSLHSF